MDKYLEKLNTLTVAEKLIAGGGVLIFIASFFDWWHYSLPAAARVFGVSGSAGLDGWSAPGSLWSTLAILVSLILAGMVVATKIANITLPALPPNWTWGLVFGGGAAAVVVLMLLKAWRITAAPYGGFGLGFFIALVATLAIAAGGWLLYTEEKTGIVRR